MTLLPDIERYIERNFGAADRGAVLDLIGNAALHDGQPPGPRLIRCALVASGGDLERLRSQLEHLKTDYRDVIVAGEYVPKAGDLVRVRNLNEPIGDDG
jgi:hypothetical protein